MPTDREIRDTNIQTIDDLKAAREAHLLGAQDVVIIDGPAQEKSLLIAGSLVYFTWYASPPPGVPGPNDVAALASYPAIVTHVHEFSEEGGTVDLFVMFRDHANNQTSIKYSPIREVGCWFWPN